MTSQRLDTCALLVGCLALASGCSGKGGDGPTQPPPGAGNHNPTVGINASSTHLGYGGPATITVSAADADGDQLSFSYSATGGTVTSSGPTATQALFTAGSQWGAASVTVTVTDGHGGSATATANMYVRNPAPPRVCAFAGSPCGSSFRLGLRPDENIVVTRVTYENYVHSGCMTQKDYAGVAIAKNVIYSFDDLDCASCSQATGNEFYTWNVEVTLHRPEPDGGQFTVQMSWNPVSATISGCSQ